jgi:YVTN family beta-propeller protein
MWRKLLVLIASAGFAAAPSGGGYVAEELPSLPDAAKAGAPFSIPGASGTVWVTERTPGSSTVTAFDAATGAVIGTAPVGSRPIGITRPHGTRFAYSSDESANQLSVIDVETVTVAQTIPMGLGPHHLMASPDGKRIYVGEFGSNYVGVVDTVLNERVAGYLADPDPTVRTHAVWITNDGNDLYATNTHVVRSDMGNIVKFDALTGTPIWNFSIGKDPSEILVTPDGKVGYVSIRGENKIVVLDLTGTLPVVIGEAEAKNEPDTLSLSNDQKTLVVGLRAPSIGPARMALIDTATLMTTYVLMPGHTITGHQWLSANSRYTFIAVEKPGALVVIDNMKASVVTEYPYPTAGTQPHGVFYEPSVSPNA